MKRNIFLSVVLCCTIACNNESKTGSSGDSLVTTATSATKAETTSSLAMTGNCGSLLLFKKGTVIEAVSYNKNGEETTRQSSTVLDVA
jgi:hypothetical protein